MSIKMLRARFTESSLTKGAAFYRLWQRAGFGDARVKVRPGVGLTDRGQWQGRFVGESRHR